MPRITKSRAGATNVLYRSGSTDTAKDGYADSADEFSSTRTGILRLAHAASVDRACSRTGGLWADRFAACRTSHAARASRLLRRARFLVRSAAERTYSLPKCSRAVCRLCA